MDDEKSVKQLIREELKKLSALTWKERLIYVWDYYKLLMAAVLLVIALISLGVTIYKNKQLNQLLTVYFVNCNSLVLNSDEISDEFITSIGGISEKDVIRIDTTVYLSDDGSQYSMSNQVKITAMVSSGNVDVMLMDPEMFAVYAEQEYFRDLSDVLTAEQKEKWSDLLIIDEKTGKVNGIDLTEAPALQKREAYFGDTVYGGVILNSTRLEYCDEFFEYLLSDEDFTEIQTENTDSAAE